MSQLPLLNTNEISSAKFSSCRTYRYSLTRIWDDSKETCVFIGLNPSTADENDDDPTIRRCIRFAKDWGFGRLVMVNLFSYRATDPKVMKSTPHPIGDDNDKHLLAECGKAQLVVAAWGNHGGHLNRSFDVLNLL